MLEVLGRATSGNVQKVLFLLERAGVPYKRHDYGKTFEGTTLTAEYKALNPTQKVPTLRDGDLHVWESHTILRYIANVQDAVALYPRDPAARSQVERWMDWTLASLNVGLSGRLQGGQVAARRTDRSGHQTPDGRTVPAR